MLIKAGLSLLKTIVDLGISGRVTTDELLKGHVSLRIGGPAEVLIQPFSWEDLRKIVVFSRENLISLFILGAGSKVLIPDAGLKGITVKLDMSILRRIEFGEGYAKLGSGVKISEFLNSMIENSYAGYEFLAGIPASLGGAVMMNAGVRKSPGSLEYIQIGNFVEELTAMNSKGEIIHLPRKSLSFNYRESNLGEYIILEVKLSGLVRKDRDEIRDCLRNFMDYRKKTQELEFPNAGCVFKNPKGLSQTSGELIELSGLKGRKIGDILISPKHANFMLNIGEGCAQDFIQLMELAQNKVKLDHNVWLEPEIRIIKN